MPFVATDLKFYYSGGAGNSNPNNALGGIISSTRVISQNASSPVNVTGVTIASANNNAQGIGLLSWSPATNMLQWQPPGSPSTYSLSGITTNGTYTLGGSDGTITVTVVAASLPVVFKQDSITITNSSHNVFDAVGALDSLNGSINYRCLYLKNTHASITVNDVKIWIRQLTTGPDEIDIGLDPAGIGNGSSTGVATTIANELTAPGGVTFSRPLTYASGLSVGTLAPSQVIAFWEKRTVPANTTGDISANTSIIGAACTV